MSYSLEYYNLHTPAIFFFHAGLVALGKQDKTIALCLHYMNSLLLVCKARKRKTISEKQKSAGCSNFVTACKKFKEYIGVLLHCMVTV